MEINTAIFPELSLADSSFSFMRGQTSEFGIHALKVTHILTISYEAKKILSARNNCWLELALGASIFKLTQKEHRETPLINAAVEECYLNFEKMSAVGGAVIQQQQIERLELKFPPNKKINSPPADEKRQPPQKSFPFNAFALAGDQRITVHYLFETTRWNYEFGFSNLSCYCHDFVARLSPFIAKSFPIFSQIYNIAFGLTAF